MADTPDEIQLNSHFEEEGQQFTQNLIHSGKQKQ